MLAVRGGIVLGRAGGDELLAVRGGDVQACGRRRQLHDVPGAHDPRRRLVVSGDGSLLLMCVAVRPPAPASAADPDPEPVHFVTVSWLLAAGHMSLPR
jgi:hypothetical protein